MEVSKSIHTTTNMSVELTTADIQEYIRNKFNLSSTLCVSVDYSNHINGRIKINWTEYSNSH